MPTRTDTTHGPTHSVAIVIQATERQKGFLSVNVTVCIIACLTHKFGLCVKLLVTSTYQWLHTAVRASTSKVMARVLHLSTPP